MVPRETLCACSTGRPGAEQWAPYAASPPASHAVCCITRAPAAVRSGHLLPTHPDEPGRGPRLSETPLSGRLGSTDQRPAPHRSLQKPLPWLGALYTYEDESDDLKLAASGGGGLQELAGRFENQKVMYGFCSVKEPQAALPKYVLVNWVGEDVADARKCACASHVAKIAEFFQGVDVIVNASSVEDVDPGAIGQRLSNGLARISSPVLHRLRLREDENTEPVGTTYQKTDAAVEMKRLNREQFWEQAKKEEELRKEEERQKVLEERLRFEQERMEQERMEQEERERRYREREEQIEEHRQGLGSTWFSGEVWEDLCPPRVCFQQSSFLGRESVKNEP
ncbi:drebrin [Terrapene carolina triunguis]|uniref:drebrin n=1 Tax=Terrapene triunguis TaxID=2587831 RepID=UPI0011561B5B|nr:drebrin [Terrapene carolina triunguis]